MAWPIHWGVPNLGAPELLLLVLAVPVTVIVLLARAVRRGPAPDH